MAKESLIYFDVGAAQYNHDPEYNGFPFPLGDPEKHKYLKKYVGIDPLLKDVQNNDKYHYYCCAVGKEKCEKLLYITSYGENSSFLKPNVEGYDDNMHKRLEIINSINVICLPLSDIIRSEGGEIDILKIDVQGTEIDVLLGADQYLSSVYAINLEAWHNLDIYPGSPDFSYLHRFLSNRNFYLAKIIYRLDFFSDLLYFNKNKEIIQNADKIVDLYNFYNIHPDNKIECEQYLKEKI